MKKITILFLFLFMQAAFSQTIMQKIEIAKDAYENGDFRLAANLAEEVKNSFKKSVPPGVLKLEIKSKAALFENGNATFELISDLRQLLKTFTTPNSSDVDSDIETITTSLNEYPKDRESFHKFAEQKEIAAREKAAADRLKKIEDERISKLLAERKTKLRPYINLYTLSDNQIISFSEADFNKKLQELSLKLEEERKIKELQTKRLAVLNPYYNYVSSYDRENLGIYSKEQFEKILKTAKADKKANARFRPFASLGFQSGEIAKHGFIYERGGKKFVGFRLSGRTSLIETKGAIGLINKSEIELGPNFRLFNGLYLNIGVGYGIYDQLINNDYAGTYYTEKTHYIVGTTGLMLRLGPVINLNIGGSFIDIDKDFYKPEITFGVSFNLRRSYKR